MNARKWMRWKRLRDFCERRMRSAWFERGNCDSKCGSCNLWESHGNVISTTSLDDGSEYRVCQNCGHGWKAIFTPAGFVEIDSAQEAVEP